MIAELRADARVEEEEYVRFLRARGGDHVDKRR